MIGRIATAAVSVADQAAALRFWTAPAGFEEKRRLPMGPAGAASALVNCLREMPWGPFAVFEDREGDCSGLRQA